MRENYILDEPSDKKIDLKNYTAELAQALEVRLNAENENLRANQIQSIQKLIEFLKAGKLAALIKQPTGAGKTRLFCEILAAINKPSLILVPRSNLIQDTKREMVGDESLDVEGMGFFDHEVITLNDPNKNAAQQLAEANLLLEEQKDFGGSVIMTYQSFLSVAKNDPILLDNFMSKIRVTIADEAHRSLGESTKIAIKAQTEERNIRMRARGQVGDLTCGDNVDNGLSQQDTAEDDLEREAEKIIKEQYPMLYLFFTATPELERKRVQDEYDLEILDWVRIQDLIEDGTLILPKLINIGTATYVTKDDVKINDSFLSGLAETGKFKMEDGRSVFEAVTDAYLKLKKQCAGYLPSVTACGTVAQAESYREYQARRDIRAVRCTSASGDHNIGVHPDTAKAMFHNEEIDNVTTVTKVGEGWDVPTLRVAKWLVPTNSPARALQLNGRIMRSLSSASHHPVKSSDNTFIIAPTFRIVRSGNGVGNGEGEARPREENGEAKEKKDLFTSLNFLEQLIKMNEIDFDYAKENIDPSLNPDGLVFYEVDENDEVEIDGETWMICIHNSNAFQKSHGIAGCTLMKKLKATTSDWRAKNRKANCVKVVGKGGEPLSLYHKSAVLEMLGEEKEFYEVDENGEVEIDSEVWMVCKYGTNIFKDSHSISGQVLMKKLKATTSDWRAKNRKADCVRKKGSPLLSLYHKSAVLELLGEEKEFYEVDENGEVEIDSEVWMVCKYSMTTFQKSHGIAGCTLTKKLKKAPPAWQKINKKADCVKTATHTLSLYRKSAVLEMLGEEKEFYEVDENGEVEIDDEVWMVCNYSVTTFQKSHDISGITLAKKLRATTSDWQAKNRKADCVKTATHTLSLYRKSAVLEMFGEEKEFYEVDENGEVEIDDEVWMVCNSRILAFQKSHGIKGGALMDKIETVPPVWHKKNKKASCVRRKNGPPFSLYRKSAVLELLGEEKEFYEVDENDEVEIDGETWIVCSHRTKIFEKSYNISRKSLMIKLNTLPADWHVRNKKENCVKKGSRSTRVSLYRKSAVMNIIREYKKYKRKN